MPDVNASAILANMREFLRASRNKSQEDVLRAFLKLVLHSGNLSEAGSILVDYPEERKLRLFNPNDFLTKEGYLKPGEPWQVEFEYGQGTAGHAYALRQSVTVKDAASDPTFSTVEGQVPICNMICVPIILDDLTAPFGVASFHNATTGEEISGDTATLAEMCVSVLALALAASGERLDRRTVRRKRVFIGCASEDLQVARIIQNQLSKTALVRVWNQGVFKAGGYVLETLLRQVKEYDCAIFLITPNDVVEIRGRRYLVARDNVLFEAGLFFSQLGRQRTFLVVPETNELHLPSDLEGLINLSYPRTMDASDLEMALASVYNPIIDVLSNPLPPIL
ncbi:MAG TPA: TIR domain-containing protein [Acetobacteraceae bacterium]|nr:TIR domain-containing protein [Acetobacteraceae bacterium]